MSAVPAEIHEYLAAVPGERGEAVRAVFDTVHTAMPAGYELETYRHAPHWVIPLSTYPVTYNGQPLSYVGLMANKHYSSLYLMALYAAPQTLEEFRSAWVASGLKPDMGKSCLRFRTLADVSLPLIAESIASMPVDRFIAKYEGVTLA